MMEKKLYNVTVYCLVVYFKEVKDVRGVVSKLKKQKPYIMLIYNLV